MTKGRICFICGKGPLRGNMLTRRGLPKKTGGVGRKITGKTKRTYKPNLQRIHALIAGKVQRIKVCTACIKAGKVVKPVRVAKLA